MNFIEQLKIQLKNFNLEEAYKLSDRIHEMESNGYRVSKEEEKLWYQLTDKIELEEIKDK